MNEQQDIITLLEQGDEKTIKHIYDLYREGFIMYAKKLQTTYDDAIDIYQETIIALCENARKGKMRDMKSSLKTYLFAIGKYMIFGLHRKATHTMDIDDMHILGKHFQWEEHDINDPMLQSMTQAYNQLGDKCKEILKYYYYENKKLDEIVYLMQYESKEVAKSQKSRCLKKIKSLIKPY